MAEVKSEAQKEITQDLAAIGSLTFTELEYRTNQDAITLLAMKNETYVSELIDPIDRISEYQELLHAVAKKKAKKTTKSLPKLIINAVHASSTAEAQKAIDQINALILALGLQTDKVIEIMKECKEQPLPISEAFETVLKEKLENAKDINATIIKKKTAQALGLQHKSSINKIADAAYLLAGMTHPCHECGHTTNTNDLQRKIDTWAEYCSMLKEYIKFINVTFPNWDDMKPKDQAEVLKYWKLLANAPFAQLQAPFLLLFINFLESYKLHQDEEAKAKALLALNLPRITTIEIARDVTTYSSLSK